MSLEEAADLANELDEYNRTHQIESFVPYDFQKKFYYEKGEGDFIPLPSDIHKIGLATRRGLMCANQIGKSYSGGMETAFHLTGDYPESGQYFYPDYWEVEGIKIPCPYAGEDIYPNGWEGHRFKKPVEGICSSTTNETTRDRCQKELLGDPADQDEFGTGAIPKDKIGKPTRKAGVPDALESILIKHKSGGWSKVNFKCYEQGKKKFMGYKINFAWCDEEPPSDIWSQLLRGLLTTNGIGYITFTPEEGITDVVYELLEGNKPGYAVTRATWDDCPHMTPEMRDQKLADYPDHEKPMRSKGEPMVGSGLIFPVMDEDITCEPFEIPKHFARIIGYDIGDDHPAALAWLAFDRDEQIAYVYRVWKKSRILNPVLADIMKSGGADWIPVAWPHDGMQHDKESGKPHAHTLKDKYEINMHPEKFSNPPSPGQKEGQGGQGVEIGLQEMLTAMIEGRLKVFSTCQEFFEEKRMYHRKDNKIVKIKDDIISAVRYAYMMQRHAITQLPIQIKSKRKRGLRTWQK